MNPTCCKSAIFRLSLPTPGAVIGTYSRLRLSRQLGQSPRQLREVKESHEVRERLERNILRAGLRTLKGDLQVLEKNLKDRGMDLDLQKLV